MLVFLSVMGVIFLSVIFLRMMNFYIDKPHRTHQLRTDTTTRLV